MRNTCLLSMDEHKDEFKCLGRLSIHPSPRYVKCPFCGEEVEMWTDETKKKCPKCSGEIFAAEATSCIEWCKYAKECLGEEHYKKLKKEKNE